MNRNATIISILTGVLLVSLITPGIAAAQQDNSSGNGNESDTAGDPITIGDLEQIAQDAEEPQTVERDLGGGAYIVDVEFHNDETATLHIITERRLRMTVTDSGSIDPDQASGTFWQEDFTLTPGEYRLKISAERQDGTQLITIVGNFSDNIYFSNKGSFFFSLPIDGPFDPSEARWIGGVAAATGAIVIIYLIWRRRRRNSKEVNEL